MSEEPRCDYHWHEDKIKDLTAQLEEQSKAIWEAGLDKQKLKSELDEAKKELAIYRKQDECGCVEYERELEAQNARLQEMSDNACSELEEQHKVNARLKEALDSLVEHTISCEKELDRFHGLENDSGSGSSICVLNAQQVLSQLSNQGEAK